MSDLRERTQRLPDGAPFVLARAAGEEEMTHNPLFPARDEENRRLAEFIGWKLLRGSWHRPECKQTAEDSTTKSDTCHPYQIPDFYTDEAANAMLLEDMPNAYLIKLNDEWECAAGNWYEARSYVFDPDRKTAVIKAYIAYREAQK